MKRYSLLLRIIGIMVMAIVSAVTLVLPARAATEPEPDSVSLDGIEVFQDLLTDGDMLFFVPYNIAFTTPPSVGVDSTFIFRLLSPDGSTSNGTAIAYPAYDDGYGNGVISFYSASGMTEGEAYIFRVLQNPAYYPTPDYWDFVIGESNYSVATDQEAALKTKVLSSAVFLTTQFDEALLETSESGTTVLSTAGSLYYLQVIPGLQSMCPSLFSVQLENPDYTKRTWSYTLADTLKTRYSDTFLGDFMTGYAGLFSMETTAAMNFLSMLIFVAIIAISVWKFKATMLSATTDGYAVLLLLMLIGFADMVLVGVIAFLSSSMGGVILFLNKS